MNQPIILPKIGYKVVSPAGLVGRPYFRSAIIQLSPVRYAVGTRVRSLPGAGPLAVFTTIEAAWDFAAYESTIRGRLLVAKCLYEPVPNWRRWPRHMYLYSPETDRHTYIDSRTGIRLGKHFFSLTLPQGTDLARWVELTEDPE